MCGCGCCIYAKSINYLLLLRRYTYLNKLKYKSKNTHNRRSGELASCIYETYKNYIMMHGSHIYIIAADMAMYKICDLPPDKHDTPQWKCVLPCC